MTLPILIDLNAALLFVAVAVFVSRYRPPVPLWPTLFVVQLFALVWIIGDIGTLVADDLSFEHASISVIYAGSYGLMAGWNDRTSKFLVLRTMPAGTPLPKR